MSKTPILINIFTLGCLIFSWLINRNKTRQAFRIAVRSFLKILPSILIVILLIGLILGLATPERLSTWLNARSGWTGLLVTGLAGAILHIPSIIAFPLTGTLLKAGVTVGIIATFITTLTMIGIVTLPLEIRELGKRFALLRNGLSFIAALFIGWLMGMIL